VRYEGTNEVFLNPERGFLTHQDQGEGDWTLNADWVRQKRNQEGISLILTIYYMNNFREKDIPEYFLNRIRNNMRVIREGGSKVVLRFAYSKDQGDYYNGRGDTSWYWTERHLNQLAPIIRENADIIAVWEAGFVGVWGEWYYSTNGLNNTTARNAVLQKWLEVLPKDRCVQVRTPAYKQTFTGIAAPLNATTAYKGTPQARIAQHNDAFMADETNMGTYVDVAKDKAFVAEEALYTPLGGETARPNSSTPPSRGSVALQELKTLHWSFLHDGYDPVVLKQWERDGVMDEIRTHLGYRLVLMRGQYSTQHAPGSELMAKLSIYNIGFAAMYNPRKVQLILRSTSGDVYVATLPDDPRSWKPRQATTLTAKVALPGNLPAGDYQLLLFLPDAEPSLTARADYAVRLANKNMWETTTGYNNLGVKIKVDAAAKLPQSTSNIQFIKQ